MTGRSQHLAPRLIYVTVFVLLSLAFIYPFAIPIILAGTVALALMPLQTRLENKNWPKAKAAAFLTFVSTLLISIPFMLFVAKGTWLIIDLLKRVSMGRNIQNHGLDAVLATFRVSILKTFQNVLSKFPVGNFLTDSRIDSYMEDINAYLLEYFQNFARSIPSGVLFLLIIILSTYSFLSHSRAIRMFFQNIFGFTSNTMDLIVSIYLRNARQVYISNILTGIIQSTIISTGVSLVVGADWFLLFFITLLFSFIPLIGAAPMAFLFAIITFFQGNNTGAVVLALLGAFAGIIDNFLRPWLASFGQSKVSPVVSFIFVLGGAMLLGFPGLFIGLLSGSIVFDTIPVFWAEIQRRKPESKFSSIFASANKPKNEELAKH